MLSFGSTLQHCPGGALPPPYTGEVRLTRTHRPPLRSSKMLNNKRSGILIKIVWSPWNRTRREVRTHFRSAEKTLVATFTRDKT